jgi:hypothetical protein
LELLSLIIKNDEIFWLITEDINLIERIFELISIYNLPEGIEFICVKLLIKFLDLNKEDEELKSEVFKYNIKLLN